MVALVSTVAFQGLEARAVEVQCQIAAGLPAFHLVGLPDKAVGESRQRVQAALAAMGLALPEAQSEASPEAAPAAPASTLLDALTVEGLDANLADHLAAAGYPDPKSLYTVTAEQLMQVEGMDQDLAFRLIDAVQAHFGE